MPNKLLLAAAALAAISFASRTADAAPQWNFGVEDGAVNGACLGNLRTNVAYYGESTPRTGDNPDSALLVTVSLECGSSVAVPSFQFPAGVVQDTTQSVVCVHRNLLTGAVLATPPCSNSPISNSFGAPNVFGWTTLRGGERLEVYVPIAYVKKTSNAQFKARVFQNFVSDGLNPTVNFNIDYNPRFANFNVVNSYDSKRADISFKLDHFHENTQVFIDYGTSTFFGSTIFGGNTDPQWTYYPTFTMPTIYGLSSNTLYYYRVRLVTPYGTFHSDTQSFRTYAQLQLPTPTVPIYECRFVRCR